MDTACSRTPAMHSWRGLILELWSLVHRPLDTPFLCQAVMWVGVGRSLACSVSASAKILQMISLILNSDVFIIKYHSGQLTLPPSVFTLKGLILWEIGNPRTEVAWVHSAMKLSNSSLRLIHITRSNKTILVSFLYFPNCFPPDLRDLQCLLMLSYIFWNCQQHC